MLESFSPWLLVLAVLSLLTPAVSAVLSILSYLWLSRRLDVFDRALAHLIERQSMDALVPETISQVDYLRSQNKDLHDRLLLMTNPALLRELRSPTPRELSMEELRLRAMQRRNPAVGIGGLGRSTSDPDVAPTPEEALRRAGDGSLDEDDSPLITRAAKPPSARTGAFPVDGDGVEEPPMVEGAPVAAGEMGRAPRPRIPSPLNFVEKARAARHFERTREREDEILKEALAGPEPSVAPPLDAPPSFEEPMPTPTVDRVEAAAVHKGDEPPPPPRGPGWV